MARNRTLGDMRSDVRLRADLVGNQFVTDSEINEYLNQALAEFYDRLVGARGQEYYATEQVITTTGVEGYALPAGHYETLYVELEDSGARVRLGSYSFHERARLIGTSAPNPGRPVAFRIIAGNITFLPAPTTGYTIRHWYEQLDVAFAMGMVQQLGARIDRLAPFRATQNTERVTNVYSSRTLDGDPSRLLPRP